MKLHTGTTQPTIANSRTLRTFIGLLESDCQTAVSYLHMFDKRELHYVGLSAPLHTGPYKNTKKSNASPTITPTQTKTTGKPTIFTSAAK